jgi:hypothetical protein
MIRYTLREDYASVPEIRKEYQKWLEYPMTQRVLRTMEMEYKAYRMQPVDTDVGAIALNSGFNLGAQKVIDDMQALDTPVHRAPAQEKYAESPVE